MSTSEKIVIELDGKSRSLRTFPQLSSNSFQHPDDREASNALQAIPLLPELFKAINAGYFDQRIRMEHLTYNVRLGPTQGKDLYAKFFQATRILDLQVVPELYLNTHPMIYAYSAGLNRPVVVLSQGCLTQLNEAEILAVIGHELGHIKCRHGLNKSLGTVFASTGVGGLSAMFPLIGPTALMAVKAALNHWSRMAEFSCDRAALLVVQDSNVVAQMLSKISGFHKGMVPDFNFDSLFAQLDDFAQYDENAFQSLVKLQKLIIDALDESLLHPSPILRIKRILNWGKSDHFQDLMSGHYPLESSKSLPPPLPVQVASLENSKTLPPPLPVQVIARCAACGANCPADFKFCPNCGGPRSQQ